jgi:type II secretory pathway pseudopilin PulG
MKRQIGTLSRLKELIRSTKGLTMVELIVATLIAAILMVSISLFLPMVFKVFQSSLNLSNDSMIKVSLETVLKEELQYARNIQILNNGKVISFFSSKTGESQIYILDENSLPTAKNEDIGLPVLQVGDGYVPLMFKEHIDHNMPDLKFTYDENQHFVEVIVTLDNVMSSFVIELLNEEDDV